MPRHAIAVFLKYPEPGLVKTRLAADIGEERAALVYRELAEATLAALPWQEADVSIHFSPAGAGRRVRAWLEPLARHGERLQLVPQADGDLGMRLMAAMDHAFARAFDTVALVGTDCPHLGGKHFRDAWTALGGTRDVVFGPARDGGYYLLALKSPAPSLFQGIPWSTSETLHASLRAAERASLRTFLLETLRDIDTLPDLTDTPWMPH